MVTVPERAPPVFEATVSCTVPSPLPLDTDTVIHGAFDVAVHRQPPPVFTVTLTGPPPLATVCCVGDTDAVHDSAWLMVNVCPATVSAPVRGAPVFAAAVKETVPFPVPVEPPVRVIQSALLAAVQAHALPAVTPTLPVPPSPGTLAFDADREYEQPAAWLIVNVLPPAVIVALRAGPPFAAAVNLTVPLPDPVAPAEIVSQSASLFADHAQPLSPCTSNDPCPPPASTDVLVGLTVNVQPWPWFTVKVRPAIVAVPERFGPVVAATAN
jgi:hypothetical protein